MNQQELLQYLQQLEFGPWAATGVIVLFFLESAPISGLLLPGIFLMVALGSLSGTDYMSFADCILYAGIGALLGDSVGYWMGYLGSSKAITLKTTHAHKEKHQRIQKLISQYGNWAVFVGRFIWFIHPLVPVAAGISRIKPAWYYLADIPAVFIWVSIYAALGHWATGAARKWTIEFFIMASIIALLVLSTIAYRYFKHKAR